jgi:hypothetical protein
MNQETASQPKRSSKKWILLLLAGGGLGICLFATFFLLHQEKRTDTCAICLSNQNVEQWRLGSLRSSIPFSSAKITFVESHISKNFSFTNHQHDWLFNHSTGSYLGNRPAGEGMGAGAGVGNDFAQLYVTTEEFRTFLNGKERAGKFSHEQIFSMLLLPRYQSKVQRQDAVINEAVKLSKSLLQEYNNR